MLEEFVKQITYLKPTIITTAVGMVIFMVSMLIVCNKFSFLGKNTKIMGFFFDMKVKDSISLSVGLLKFFLIVSLFFTGGKIQTVHIACFIFLVVLLNIFQRRIRDVLISIFNSAVIVGVLFLIKFLISYLQNVLFDVRILIAVILLGIFLIMYSVYDVCCSVSAIIERRTAVVIKESKKN